MRLFRPWPLFRVMYPQALFRINSGERTVYLTFDDGPDPGSTPKILGILSEFNVRAHFFCCGEAAEKHPGLMDEIRSHGHKTGNHGFRHLDGWKTPADIYCDNVKAADNFTSDSCFRPPYGHLTIKQYRRLKGRYKIVFWDLMPYDFDTSFRNVRSLDIIMKKLRNGSVIVLHDSPGSSCIHYLKEFIQETLNRGYRFNVLCFSD